MHRRTIERRHDERDEPRPLGSAFDLLGSGVSNADDRAELDPNVLAAEEDAQFEAATLAAASADSRAEELRLLDEMTRIAEEARARPDARVRCLLD